ncbi:hypothetical protein BGZ83_000386 [Gryganskiella cystojenkinii]|nr:hypothetical protein BGZ83_000386 [Gryganskiella cystojenkinii]
MENSTWTSNPPTAQHPVGPMPMGFEWSRDQNMPSDSIPRPIGLQGPAFQASHHHNGNGNGTNGNGLVHNQPSPSVTPSLSAPMGLNDGGLGGNGLHGPDAAAFNPNQLHQHQHQHQQQHQHQHQQQQQQQQQRHPSDMSGRAGSSSSPREEFHHHHMHPSQQQLHQNHSPYNQGHLHGHDFPSQDQQQLQQHQQQPQPFQHSVYSTVHYYPDTAQHEPYEHSRAHSGGLVGPSYGHSQDNLTSLTPPPSAPAQSHDLPPLRARLTHTVWEDERTFCFQVDVKGVCVARRSDNNMVNGTKLLNVVGMSRGKRDGILKNEKGRIVVKVGAMHLKGVWIPLDRAVHHAKAHNIEDSLHPLLVEDPTIYLHLHPHGPVMSSDPRWASQQQQQLQQHEAYRDPEDSPSLRHTDSHGGHHFNQSNHGEYYPHPHHGAFRGHGLSPHGSPNGSNGSISGDDDPNLVSPFDYRVQTTSVGAGGLIGIPSSGSSGVADLRAGPHHPSYYGHQTSPHQYYSAHPSQKYQEPMLHPGQHQLQLGGPLASDSPPLPTTSSHEGSLHRLHGGYAGQKRTHNYCYSSVSEEAEAHVVSVAPFGSGSLESGSGNSPPPISMALSESHSYLIRQSAIGQKMDQPSKRPRSAVRGKCGSPHPSSPPPGQRYGRDENVKPADQSLPSSFSSSSSSHHLIVSNESLGPANSLGNTPENNTMSYSQYESVSLTSGQQQQQQQHSSRDIDAARPRYVPCPRSRLSSFQEVFDTTGALASSGNAALTFGYSNNASPSREDAKYGRHGNFESDPNAHFIKVEGMAGGHCHGQAEWS